MHAWERPAAVGILGGMGPAATADFYRKLVQATPAARDQDHLAVLVEADPSIPDRTAAFLHGGPSPLPWLRRAGKALECRGAALVVMPCNTAHLWHAAVAQQLCVPLLHIVDAVAQDLCDQLGDRAAGGLRVGLLGTSATVAGELYPRRAAGDARTAGWTWELPPAGEQAELEAGIAAIKASAPHEGAARIRRVYDALADRGVDAIVQACTEVPLALEGHACRGVATSDSTAALARFTVRHARGAAGAATQASC